MSLSSDNFTASIYLRDQAKKWKNISFLMIIAILLLTLRLLFGSADNNKNIDKTSDFIASINIEGVIFNDTYRNEVLERISTQENIKAVIVNINSPGGGIVGSENLYSQLRDIASKKPIVVVMGSVAASGGYMAAIASDHIIARNGTLTGSIGVIMQSSEITELASKIGVKFVTYKSSPLKGSPSPFEKTTPLTDQVIQSSVKDIYDFFSEMVKERRGEKLTAKNLSKILDGRIFTGRQALQNGLIDQIGGKKEALNYLSEKKQIDVEEYQVRKIDLEKKENALLSKFVGEATLSKIIGKITNGFGINSNQLMSVWTLN